MNLCLLSEEPTLAQTIISPIVVILIVVLVALAIRRSKVEKEKAAEAEAQAKALQLQQFINDAEAHIKNIESNGLPQVKNVGLQLAKDEVCHFCGDATYSKIKNQVVGQTSSYYSYTSKYGGRSGSGRKEVIRENVEYKTNGKLYVTNKRVIFVAPMNSKQISIDSIVSISPYNQSFVIIDKKGENIFDVTDRALFWSVLSVVSTAARMGLDLQKLTLNDGDNRSN